MKITNKIGIAASMILAAMISSCSDKGYWEEAPSQQGISFESEQYNADLAPGPQEIALVLHRSETGTEQSVNVTFTPTGSCPSDITVESPVVFKAGSNTANVIVKIADAQPPYTYTGVVKADAKASYAGVVECTLKMPVSYTWSSIGIGAFYDAFVMDGATAMYDVEIMKAEGFERYRVMNPYVEYYETLGEEMYGDWWGSNGPSYIEFWELSNGTLMFNAFYSGLNYQGAEDQPINVYPYSSFTTGVAGYDVWYQKGYALLSPFYYIPNVGSFGQQQYAIQIILPE